MTQKPKDNKDIDYPACPNCRERHIWMASGNWLIYCMACGTSTTEEKVVAWNKDNQKFLEELKWQ